VKRLIDLLGGIELSSTSVPDVAVAGLCLDSRRIVAGDAFVALRGAAGHGLEHAAQALALGATIVLHDEQVQPAVSIAGRCLCIPGLGEHLPTIARRMYDDPVADLELLAVTGTNGKTSVAWLLAQALDGAMLGSLGAGRPGALVPATHTTPDLLSLYATLAALRDQGERVVVLEASSHALDQQRLAGLAFETVILTNLGRDHLDYHGSIEAYGAAKAKLFFDYPACARLINVDDPFGRRLAMRLGPGRDLITYGLQSVHAPDFRAACRRLDLDGMALEMETPSGRLALSSRLVGRHNALNLAVVVAELARRGVDSRQVLAIVRELRPVPGRMSRVPVTAKGRVIVDYAHSPDALDTALRALRELTPERLICVFGCGGGRDRGKRPLMGRIAEALADVVVLTDDNPRHEDPTRIVREIQAGMRRPERVRVIRERAEAIRAALAMSRAGDCVLIAGKGNEPTQDYGDRIVDRSDFDILRNLTMVAA